MMHRRKNIKLRREVSHDARYYIYGLPGYDAMQSLRLTLLSFFHHETGNSGFIGMMVPLQ